MSSKNRIIFLILFITSFTKCTCLRELGEHPRAAEVAVDASKVQKGAEAAGKIQENVRAAQEIEKESEYAKTFAKLEKDESGIKYDNQVFEGTDEIPISTDKILFKGRLTNEDAASLSRKGVKFLYDANLFETQSTKPYKIIMAMSDNVQDVKKMYELDDYYANDLIKKSSKAIHDPNIIKANSYEEMIQKQNEVINRSNQIPILIYHDNKNYSSYLKDKIKAQTNVITCNSYDNPNSAIKTTDFIDMAGLADALERGANNPDLFTFYQDFVSSYYNYINKNKKKKILITVGISAGVGAGVYLICYYYDSN